MSRLPARSAIASSPGNGSGGVIADFVCPACRERLTSTGADARSCPRCAVEYPRRERIWRMLAAGREQAFEEFVRRYETVRKAQGRAVESPEALRELPYRAPSTESAYEWFIRARSFATLLGQVVGPAERSVGAPLRIVDAGSGLGWLAYRLARRGHEVAAVDLLTNAFDGLGAHRRYDASFASVQAELDRLPFGPGSVDLVVYNASFHYAADFATTLAEAFRVLAPGGRAVVVDTPLYRDAASGRQMVDERERSFAAQYGMAPGATRSEGFLTYDRLESLGASLALRWRVIEPWYGLRWWLKPWLARLRGSREPARFKLVVFCRHSDPS